MLTRNTCASSWDDYNIDKYMEPESAGQQALWSKQGKIKASVIRNLIDKKYSAIRELLVKDMVIQSVGADDWSVYKDDDLIKKVD